MDTCDGQRVVKVAGTSRTITVIEVELENRTRIYLEESQWDRLPLKSTSTDVNAQLNAGLPPYTYNRLNYIETQDYMWEQKTYQRVEGWTPAPHDDVLAVGMPIKARRQAFPGGTRTDFAQADIIEYVQEASANQANDRVVTVRFTADGVVQTVPLSDVLIWQRGPHGPQRTVPFQTRKFESLDRRYVDVRDPEGEAQMRLPHFLDEYEPKETKADALRTVKSVMDVDAWSEQDHYRAENHRLLSNTHRADYLSRGYFPKYTSWEFILLQEADQPIIESQMRRDNVGPSLFFNANRFWRYKRRPFGYLRNYDNEIRDFFQYVDSVTPWKKAKMLRTLWEVRSHHPMPAWHRPSFSPHRNSSALLPAHLFEIDKKTGKVKALKDTVADYTNVAPNPSWVDL